GHGTALKTDTRRMDMRRIMQAAALVGMVAVCAARGAYAQEPQQPMTQATQDDHLTEAVKQTQAAIEAGHTGQANLVIEHAQEAQPGWDGRRPRPSTAAPRGPPGDRTRFATGRTWRARAARRAAPPRGVGRTPETSGRRPPRTAARTARARSTALGVARGAFRRAVRRTHARNPQRCRYSRAPACARNRSPPREC